MIRFFILLFLPLGMLGCQHEVVLLVTPAPLSAVPEFEIYEGDGYQIVIPVSAEISQSDTITEFTYRSSAGNYTMRMQPINAPTAFSAETVLQGRTTTVANPSEIDSYTINDGQTLAASRSYALGNGGEYCATLRPMETVLIRDERAFVLQMISDAPDACDTLQLEDSRAIVKSTRLD